jgi:hypothetical protein
MALPLGILDYRHNHYFHRHIRFHSDSGFSHALSERLDAEKKDYDTVFIFNFDHQYNFFLILYSHFGNGIISANKCGFSYCFSFIREKQFIGISRNQRNALSVIVI